MNNLVKKENKSFIKILIQILDNQSLQNIIKKNEENNGFIILNQKEFVEKILLQYYKSKTFASFRRSLNSYGFQVYKLQNGQKLFINKNINTINSNLHKRYQTTYFENYCSQIESDHQILILQLSQLKRNQELMEQSITKILQIQQELTKKMKQAMIQYIYGLLDAFIKGKKDELFVLQFCFSIKNKQFKKYIKNNLKKALSLPDINYYPINDYSLEIYNHTQQNIGFLELMMKLNFNIHNVFSDQLFNRMLLNNCYLDNKEIDKEEDYDSNLSNFFCLNQIEM